MNKNKESLIKLIPYPNSSSLRFGGSYCKNNLLLLKTLIEATDKLESEERNSEFPKKLFETWSEMWLIENKKNESYKSKQTMRDFFSFGYHIGIWNNNFKLTDLAKKTLADYKYKDDINTFKSFFDVLLRNFIVSYKYKTYNPLLLFLMGLENKPEKQSKIDTRVIKEIFNEMLNYSLENWKSRMFYLLLSSSNYFQKNNKNNHLELKEEIKNLMSECNNKYHHKDIYEIQQDIDDQTKKSQYLTTGKTDDKSNEEFSFKRIPNEKNQVIYFGTSGVGKSYLLDSKIKNIFGSDSYYENNVKRISLNKNTSFEELFWRGKSDESIQLGFLLKFLIKAISNPNEYFILIIEDVGYYNYIDVFNSFFSLFERDKDGFSKYPLDVDGKIAKKIIELFLEEIKPLGEHQKKKMKNLIRRVFFHIDVTDDNIDISEMNDFKISFTPNFYIWSTLNSFDNWSKPFNNYFKRRWDFQYIDINNGEENIEEYKFKLKFSSNGKTRSVSWNKFRKIINDFISNNLELNESKLMGTFFINIDTLKECESDEDKLTEIIKNKILFYLYDDVGSSNLWDIFNKKNASSFSSLLKNFSIYGTKVFSEDLKLKLEEEFNK